MYTQISAYPAGAKCFFLPAGEAPCSGSFHHQKNSYLRDIPPGTLIGCILREGEVIVPSGWTSLRIADRLILISQPEHYGQLLGILNGEEV